MAALQSLWTMVASACRMLTNLVTIQSESRFDSMWPNGDFNGGHDRRPIIESFSGLDDNYHNAYLWLINALGFQAYPIFAWPANSKPANRNISGWGSSKGDRLVKIGFRKINPVVTSFTAWHMVLSGCNEEGERIDLHNIEEMEKYWKDQLFNINSIEDTQYIIDRILPEDIRYIRRFTF